MSAEEVRTTSITGGEKGVKPAQFSLLPMEALKEVAEHYGAGAQKYEKHNMRKGYEWSKSFDAAMRHLTQFWAGEDRDEETGSKHLAAVVFHALTLMEFMETHREYDDRYKPEEATSNSVAEEAQKLWAEVQKAANDPRRWMPETGANSEDHGLIVHETVRPTPGEIPIAHFGILRDGRVVQNLDLDAMHEESVREQVRDTTQESYDAWDAGRPFGSMGLHERLTTPIKGGMKYPSSSIYAMPINRDGDKQ